MADASLGLWATPCHADDNDPELGAGIVWAEPAQGVAAKPEPPIAAGRAKPEMPSLSVFPGDYDEVGSGIRLLDPPEDLSVALAAARSRRPRHSGPLTEAPRYGSSHPDLDLDVCFNDDGTEQDSAELLLRFHASMRAPQRPIENAGGGGRRISLSGAVRRRSDRGSMDSDDWDVDADGTTLRLGEFLSIGDSGIQVARPPTGSSGPAVVREAGLGEGRPGTTPHTPGGPRSALPQTPGPSARDAASAAGHAGVGPLLGSPTAASTPAVVLRGNIRTELVMLDRLGVGASATVQRALHLPSLQLVAVKHVKLADASHRHQIASELRTLHANLTPLGRASASNAVLRSARVGRRRGSVTAGGGGPLSPQPQRPTKRRSSGGASSALSSGVGGADAGFAEPPTPSSAATEGGGGGGGEWRSPASSAAGTPVAAASVAAGAGGGATLRPLPPSCPYIVRFYDAYTTKGRDCATVSVVMEFMGGGSLQDVISRGGTRDEAVLARIAAHSLRGLAFLHAHHELHRDIKPDNILVATAGDAFKLADFGIAMHVDGPHAEGAGVGTTAYMSPERLDGGGAGYSFASDIWSIGLTLLAVAAGRFPYDTTDSSELCFTIVMQREPPLHILSPPPSDELLDFLRQCLRRDPAQRPSAEELLSHAFIERHAAPMPASTADPATDEPMAQAAAAAAAHGAAAAAAGGTSDADGSLFWYERPVGAPLTEASLGGGVAGHSARARSPSAADAASGLDDDDAGCSASESVSAASVEEDGAHALTWSQTDKHERAAGVSAIAATVLDRHWDVFVQYFRRHPSRRRRKWYYELGGRSTIPVSETGLSPADTSRRLSATLVSVPRATAHHHAHVPVPVHLAPSLTPLLPPSQPPPPPAPPRPADEAAALPAPSALRFSRQASMEAGTPSEHTLAHVTARELLLEVGDVEPLGAQLGVPAMLVREVFNNAIIAKRGEEAAAAVAARVPDATSDVAVFYIAHPPHEAARSRPPTPTGAQAAARESKGA